ncbi:MAG: hypothetical protein AYK18_13885 [Theionarchaea archaeon DG-70]|nr:MAG: hypothetical protein AYK18_13885 [Theionarchaea archaeon DG-70]
MPFVEIGKIMDINNKTAAKFYRWALREELMLPPFLRLNSFPNYQEYVYFLKFKDTTSVFEKLKSDPRVIYQSVCGGAFDLMVMASEKIDVSTEEGFESIFLSGSRSDFIFNKVEIKSMQLYIDEFCQFLKSGNFIRSKITFPARGELVWNDLDWCLFDLLKYDARRKYLDVIKRLNLKSKSLFYEHLNKVLESCTVWTPYFPKRYKNYNEYFVLFKSDHESQLVEKLKAIPVHCPIFKVKDWIYAYISIRGSSRHHCHLRTE